MKTFLTALCTLVILSSFGQSGARANEKIIIDIREKEKAAIGKTFPDFEGNCNGTPINNESLKGKTVFVNFWFEACLPCVAEFEALNDLYKDFKGKAGFEFISFTYESPEKIEEIKAKYKIEYKIISVSRGDCYRLSQGNGFPTNLILDRDLTIAWLISGGPSDKDQAKDFIRSEVYPRIVKEL